MSSSDRPAFAAAPEWILEELRKGRQHSRPKAELRIATELDHPNAIARAVQWLRHEAPTALQGAGGDETTLRVAYRVRDFGVSEEVCFELVAEHWNENERASPPWDAEELRQKVENAYRYARGAAGSASALAEFEPVELAVEGMDDPLSQYDVHGVTRFDETAIPRRQWVVDHILAKSYLTSLVAPPGAGKTNLEILIALAVVTGRPLLGFRVHGRGRVFLWNQEDDMEELKRRLLAAMHAHGITFDDLLIDGEPGLIIGSGAEKPLTVVKRGENGMLALTKTARTLPDYLRAKDIAVAMFDPLVELHQATENDNVEMGLVARVFRSMAKTANCAVLLVHHTRKPPSGDSASHVGNMDSSRGAGSVMGVSRMALTLYTIDHAEADRRGVQEEDRHRYVRLDDAKNNLSLSGGEPVFFKREGINIRNLDEEPEEIGVLTWVQLEKRKTGRQAAESDLLSAVSLVVGETEGRALPVGHVADRLMASDPIYAEGSRESLMRTVKRTLNGAEARALGLEMQERRWPGLPRTNVVVLIGQAESACPTRPESSTISDT